MNTLLSYQGLTVKFALDFREFHCIYDTIKFKDSPGYKERDTMKHFDTIVIGGGPAGMSGCHFQFFLWTENPAP